VTGSVDGGMDATGLDGVLDDGITTRLSGFGECDMDIIGLDVS
jgi:hypothetical protein